jgi:phosphoglycerol transferase
MFGALLAAVAALGVYEQTSSYFVPPYRSDAREYRSDARFVAGIERRLPPGSAVFNLPYVPFPEGYQQFPAPDQTVPYSQTVNFEYDEVRGYLHSTTLRWSYGAMKGRPANWEAQLAAKPLDLALAGAAAAGFSAVVIDQRGYPGMLGPELRRELRELLGAPPTASQDGQLLFSDLRPYARRLQARHTAAQLAALRSAVLDPLRLSCSTGRLTITNPGRAAHTAALTAGVAGATRVVLGGSVLRSNAGAISQTLRVPAGTASIPVRSLRSSGAALLAPTVIDSAFMPFAPSGVLSIATGVIGPPCARVALGP